jgi:DNA-3-methyladenine glycosylase
MRKRLGRKFFQRPTLKVAKELLGKYLVRKIGKKVIAGKIVETEAYIGPKDKASHAYGGKVTKRNQAEYLKGGHIYIYLVYGMYWQLNITTNQEGRPECVLIRALEPVEGIEGIKNYELGIRNLANGPGKLCRWLKLDRSFYGEDLCKSKRIWLEDRGVNLKKSQIVKAKRIGIDYAEEWAEKLWRFYLKGSEFVSRY